MIVIIAPYSPPSRLGTSHLGASRKLETIISIFSKLEESILLVNSAHNDKKPATVKVDELNICGVNVIEVTPPIYSKRIVGKLRNLFDIDEVINVIKKYGSPRFIWIYNGYAFEMLLATKVYKFFKAPIILEFEDWHFSRSRGFNPKPYIDYFLWRKAAKLISGAFVVNSNLAEVMRKFTNQVEMLPGIVPEVLSKIAKSSVPFSKTNEPIKVGFFGGLSVEKGADIVLDLAKWLPDGYVVHVTGAGPLENNFREFAKANPNRLFYYGRVNDSVLYELIGDCDVILNPHSSIEAMDNGVFPFKVIEAIASGRLLITTKVPENELSEILAGVQFVNHEYKTFLEAVLNSEAYYSKKSDVIKQCALIANQMFGEQALLEKVKKMLSVEKVIF